MNEEKNIYPRWVYQGDRQEARYTPGRPTKLRRVKSELYDVMKENHEVGDVVLSHVAAPGTGSVEYRITRIEPDGIYGVLVSSTVRELEPWEVR